MDLWKMVTLMGDAYHRLAARLRLVSSDVPGFLFRCGSLHTRRICVAYTHPQGKVAQQAPRCYDLEERTPIAIQRYGPDMGWEGRSSLLSLYVSPRWKKVTIRTRVSIFGALAAY